MALLKRSTRLANSKCNRSAPPAEITVLGGHFHQTAGDGSGGAGSPLRLWRSTSVR